MAEIPSTNPLTLPDLEGSIVDRLLLCYRDMGTGLKRALAQPPLTSVDVSELPMATTMIGPLLTPIESGGETVDINRRFFLYVYMYPIAQGLDDPNLGAESLQRGIPLVALFRNYFTVHTHLSTSALLPLEHVWSTSYLCEGVNRRAGPGGIEYISLRAQLDVFCKIKVKR